jgi:3'-phosphoadenosine 5'-phosphosulfate sulfotransferase (PAPS reductase)/FAD synthetase
MKTLADSTEKPHQVVALSGGKDSTALALRLKELHPHIPWEFVCTPTGDELPPMQAHWENLNRLLGGVKMLPTKTLEEIIEEKHMVPTFRARFCTRELKLEPFFEYMETLPAGSLCYVGLRADEPDRVGAILGEDDQFDLRYPFRDWGWGLPEVTEYLACRGVEIPARTDCGACFYQRLGEWKDLWQQYPERYEQYVQIEAKISKSRGKAVSFRSPQRDTWPAQLKDLRKEFERGRPLHERKAKDPSLAACPWCSK